MKKVEWRCDVGNGRRRREREKEGSGRGAVRERKIEWTRSQGCYYSYGMGGGGASESRRMAPKRVVRLGYQMVRTSSRCMVRLYHRARGISTSRECNGGRIRTVLYAALPPDCAPLSFHRITSFWSFGLATESWPHELRISIVFVLVLNEYYVRAQAKVNERKGRKGIQPHWYNWTRHIWWGTK